MEIRVLLYQQVDERGQERLSSFYGRCERIQKIPDRDATWPVKRHDAAAARDVSVFLCARPV